MSACAMQSEHRLPKWRHTPGAQIVRQRGVPIDEETQKALGGRIWLGQKLLHTVDEDLVLERLSIQSLADWADGTADTDWMLPVFWGICRGFFEPKIGEVGMRNGISTLAFLMAARDTGGHVYSIDIDECVEGRRNVLHAGLAEHHTFIHGDSAAVEFPEPLDVLFIDGEHTYPGVTLDFQMHAPKMKKGGVILFHDTTSCPEVAAFCSEIGATMLPMGAGLGVLGC